MNGYRRIEPAYCRGCGSPWVPGADACPSCGEAIVRERAPSGDPRALPKLRAVLVAASVLVVVHWAVPIAFAAALDPTPVIVLSVAALAIVVATARWWMPGERSTSGDAPAPAVRPRGPWLAAVGLGLGLPLAFGLAIGQPLEGLPLLTLEAGLWAQGFAPWLIVLAFVAIVLEEAFFRGLLFRGVAPIGGVRNAAIASSLVFALTFVDAVLAILGVLASILRAWSGSVGPALAFRLVAAVTWLAWCWSVLG